MFPIPSRLGLLMFWLFLALFSQPDSLFGVLEGTWRGHFACSSTSKRWIQHLISQAYGKRPIFLVKVYSTGIVFLDFSASGSAFSDL